MPNDSGSASASRHSINANLDASNAMMASMAECFALQHSTLNIPYFDGKNLPLKDFLQDIHNGAVYVPPTSEGAYVRAVLGKLQGPARDSTYGKIFNSVNELTKHLKVRFAPGKTYPYYHHEIENIRMKRNESVNDFYDRLNILISGARVSLEDKYGDDAEHMLKPIIECGLDAFLRGLPDEIAKAVDLRDPKNLEEALKYAVRMETRMQSGILPSGEPQRLFPRSQSPTYQNSPTPRNYSNYPIIGETETRARSPSPNRLRYPLGILRSTSRSESQNYPPLVPLTHSKPQSQYPNYQHPPYYPPHPFYYPPMQYPYYPPYSYNYPNPNPIQNRPISPGANPSTSNHRSDSPVRNGSRRPNDNITSGSRSPSPHNNRTTDNLNFQGARRLDATTGQAPSERQHAVRFEKPRGEFLRAGQIENHQ